MADFKAYAHLSVTPPNKISKDVPVSDSSIPLSPQWLHSKPGESKAGMALEGNHSSPYSASKNHEHSGRLAGDGEKVSDPPKKKDVYRPTFLEMESARRDRWRDEERDTNGSIRRDRWREGDKDLGDTRKMDRRANNSPAMAAKNFGEGRRVPSERWVDPSKEAAFDQRRENKWNTRWGPDDKETDKWSDFGKHGDASHERAVSHLNHGKDEREGDHVRPWRPNSAISRGRTDPLHHQSHITSKEGHSFGHGYARGDNAPPTYPRGHGRLDSDINSNAKIPNLGQSLDKADNGHVEASLCRYDRAKLLDLYSVTDMRLLPKLLDGFSQVPSLTQEEPVEPFALSALTMEELATFRGIDKGDIISSGAPQKSKDGSVGQGSSDFVQTRRPRPGSRDGDDVSNNNVDDSIDPYSSLSVGSFHDKQTPTKVFRDGPPGAVDDMERKRETVIQSNALPHSSTAWKSSVERAYPSSHGWFDPPAAVQSKSSEISWSEAQKERSGFAKLSYPPNELKRQTSEDQTIRRQQFVPADRELEARKLLQPSPEDLILYYKDPQGQLQGPFSGIDIIGWFEAGYFGIDLLVRLANAPPDSPFSLLGDMMPHLRAKARPPPGFSSSKPNEMPYLSPRPVHTGPSGIDMLRNEHKLAHRSTNEAEKRFLESLMSGSVSSSPLDRFSTYEGSQGYTGHNSISQPKGLSGITDMSHQPSHPQNMDMMSVLQGLSDSSTVRVNNEAGGWSGFPVQGGMDPLKDKIDLHQHQNLPPQAFGLPQQRVQPQNHPSVAHLLSQTVDNPSTIANHENLLSSSLAQDPQILNLLHHQQLFQMQPQTSLSLQQLSLLDKLLLIKQQQKQEEQLRVQQQQLLSQVLNEHHLRLGEPAYGQIHPAVTASVPVGSSVAITAGSTPVDHLQQMVPQQILQVGPQVPASTLAEYGISKFAETPHHVSQQISYTVGSKASSVQLPHQTFADHRQNLATMPAQDGEVRPKDSSINTAFTEGLSIPGVADSCFQVDSTSKDGLIGSESLEISHGKLSGMTSGNETSVPEQATVSADLASTGPGIKDNQINNVTSVIEEDVKQVEVREVRKTSEKKSRKQKSSKAQTSSEQVKGVAKSSLQRSKQAQTGVTSENKSDVPVVAGLMDNSREAGDTKKIQDTSEVREFKSSDCDEKQNTLENSAHRGWKPTINVKPKSLLEIQQEEERKVKTEVAVSAISSSVSSLSLSAPWAGVISSSEQKVFRDNFQGVSDNEMNVSKTENSVAKKSQLHDLLAAEVLAKSSEQETFVEAGSSLPSFPLPNSQVDAVDDDFIEAKDTKKGRKKAGKTKAAGSKSSTSVPSVDAVVSFIETGKSSRKVQQEEVLSPAPSVGLSLGDFVPWKEEATSPSPAPAWSTDSGKLPKPTSLRDILFEEQRRGAPTQKQQQLIAAQKSQAMQVSHTSSRSSSATLPTKASAPMSSQASAQTKYTGEDDLFWGPPEQSKQEKERLDFPQLGNPATPVKPTAGASLTSQKSAGRKGVEILSPPNSAQSSHKLKHGGDAKRSEAMEFRSWCESEFVRLTGSKDTSFLEFCLKQSRSEAEILLAQNLGGLDPNHRFINKFLDYMDMLPSDVLSIAFQGQNDHKATAYSAPDMTSDNTAFGDSETATSGLDGSAKGGKKKGKKGKKVSPAVLGFNIVSNRIMMGEIQTIDD